MPEYKRYVIVGFRFGRTIEDDSDEYGWLVYAPDGRLVGDRWTYDTAIELVESDLRERHGNGLEG